MLKGRENGIKWRVCLAGIANRDQGHRLLDRVMAPEHLPFNLAIRIGQLARGPLGRPEDSELVVHHLLDRFTGADLTETRPTAAPGPWI